jgi:hypothetical protein
MITAMASELDPQAAYMRNHCIEVFTMECWKCRKQTRVLIHPSDWSGSKDLAQAGRYFPWFYVDYSHTVGHRYWMNHCEHCKAKMGDWFVRVAFLDLLNSLEPDDPRLEGFYRLLEAEAS